MIDHNSTMRLRLIEQLIYFDEQKRDLLDLYFPASGHYMQERMRVNRLISRYMTTIEQLVQESGTQAIPLKQALIDTTVTYCNMLTSQSGSYTLTLPEQAQPAEGKISFISPVGLQLLLVPLDAVIPLFTMRGETDVMITNISCASELSSPCIA